MRKTLWRSLKTRIVLLAIVTCIFFAVAGGSLYSFLRSSHRATVQEAAHHLSLVASGLAGAFSNQSAHGLSLLTVPHPGKHPPPPPPLERPQAEQQTPPPPPVRPVDPLSQLTAKVLQKEEGIEGGFLAGSGPLVGYAFPTHEGPGQQKEMPERERPTIDDLAHKAEQTASAQSFTFEGPHDVILFTAQPVREVVDGSPRVTGAVWLMQRLPDINAGGSKQLLFAALGFGAAALVTALLAWFVTVEVSGGMHAVTERLAGLEQDLSQPVKTSERPQLAEFDRVLSGINAMAVSLRSRIANEKTLEDQLRHRERLSSLGQFAAGVAHELRNPLATIRLRAQMSQHQSTEGTVVRNSGIILEEVDRLDAMIGRLLYFARPISLNLEVFSVEELCSFVLQSWQGRAPESTRFSCLVPAGMQVRADRNRLVQVLDNLIENAIQASHGEPPQIKLDASQAGDSMQFDVADRGSGFSPDALNHAFDPFYTTKETGTGLGLSIAFELVEAHGGQLRVSSRPGGGAMVSVVLPQPTGLQETSA